MRAITRSQIVRRIAGLCAAAAVLSLSALSTRAADANMDAPADANARYTRDRAKCLSGESNQDRATCLREAGAAREAAKRGGLDDHGARYRKNAKQRCDVLTGDEQRDCIARMKGASNSSASGSAQAGGIIRETVTLVPADPAASAAPAR